MSARLDDLPGYRRRFIVTAGEGWVRSELEDDYHCMSVTIYHDGKIATSLDPVMERAPWTTCPGAKAQLERTFTGIALDSFGERGEKSANCTHLHDLAVLAAAHAKDKEPLIYDILVSDPIDGKRRAELRRNGATVMSWVLEADSRIVEPKELSGLTLFNMRPWIESLDHEQQELAKLLRWGATVAHGRTVSWEFLSDASRMRSGQCYTFQPHIRGEARRIGEIKDFSKGTAQPLDKRRAAVLKQSG